MTYQPELSVCYWAVHLRFEKQQVATVDAAGVVTVHALGSADITATIREEIHANSPGIGGLPAKLVHRYSFGEAPGSTVADSVGTAAGLLQLSAATLTAQVNSY
jgi:hypothetical protein